MKHDQIAKQAIEMTAQIAADVFSQEIDMLDEVERSGLANKVEAAAKEHWNKYFTDDRPDSTMPGHTGAGDAACAEPCRCVERHASPRT